MTTEPEENRRLLSNAEQFRRYNTINVWTWHRLPAFERRAKAVQTRLPSRDLSDSPLLDDIEEDE
jgi:hypothetical protein